MKALDIFGRVIAFHPALVDLTGSVTSALMLSQAIYWTKITDDPDGWFWKTGDEWREETGMSRHEQDGARKKLRALDYDGAPIWYENLKGLPAKMYYRLDVDVLDAWTAAYKFAEIRQTGSPDSGKQDARNPANILYTESTSKSTSKNGTIPDTESLGFEDAIEELIRTNYVTALHGFKSRAKIDMFLDPFVLLAQTYGMDKFKAAFQEASDSKFYTGTNPEHIERLIKAVPEQGKESAGDIISRMTDADYVPSDDVLASMNMIEEAMRPR